MCFARFPFTVLRLRKTPGGVGQFACHPQGWQFWAIHHPSSVNRCGYTKSSWWMSRAEGRPFRPQPALTAHGSISIWGSFIQSFHHLPRIWFVSSLNIDLAKCCEFLKSGKYRLFAQGIYPVHRVNIPWTWLQISHVLVRGDGRARRMRGLERQGRMFQTADMVQVHVQKHLELTEGENKWTHEKHEDLAGKHWGASDQPGSGVILLGALPAASLPQPALVTYCLLFPLRPSLESFLKGFLSAFFLSFWKIFIGVLNSQFMPVTPQIYFSISNFYPRTECLISTQGPWCRGLKQAPGQSCPPPSPAPGRYCCPMSHIWGRNLRGTSVASAAHTPPLISDCILFPLENLLTSSLPFPTTVKILVYPPPPKREWNI